MMNPSKWMGGGDKERPRDSGPPHAYQGEPGYGPGYGPDTGYGPLPGYREGYAPGGYGVPAYGGPDYYGPDSWYGHSSEERGDGNGLNPMKMMPNPMKMFGGN